MTRVIGAILIVGALFTFTARAERAEEPQFKGVELYSFTVGQENVMRFALLPGTNMIKQANQLREEAVTYYVLMEKIKSLAPNEDIYWFNQMPNGNLDKVITLKYPENNKIEEIKLLCKRLNIALHIEYKN